MSEPKLGKKSARLNILVFFKCLAFGEMQFSGENQRMRASNKTLSPSLSLAQEAAPPIRCRFSRKKEGNRTFFLQKKKFYGKVPIIGLRYALRAIFLFMRN